MMNNMFSAQSQIVILLILLLWSFAIIMYLRRRLPLPPGPGVNEKLLAPSWVMYAKWSTTLGEQNMRWSTFQLLSM